MTDTPDVHDTLLDTDMSYDPQPLHSYQIKALRNADVICFDWLNNQPCSVPPRPSGGVHQVRAVLEQRNSPTGFEQSLTIDATGTVTCHRGSSSEYKRGYAFVGSAKYVPHVQTFVHFLREGDEIVLRWVAGNNNDYVEKAGLFVDELYVGVKRTNKMTQKSGLVSRTVKRYEFYMASVVCKDNTARMVCR